MSTRLLAIRNNLEQMLLERRSSWNPRPEQIQPQSDWRTWLILAGRGFGKTRTGAETIKQLVASGHRKICLLGKTINEVRSIMVDGVSGLLSCYHPADAPKFYPSRKQVVWRNGAIATMFGADNVQSLRGPQFDCVWIDELAKFHNPIEVMNQVKMCLRLGKPKMIITTTPTPHPLIRKLAKDPAVHVTYGSTLDNRTNLSHEFISSILSEYGSTSFGRQEIYGEIISDDANTLWLPEHIKYCANPPLMDKIIVSVDPSVTCTNNSDETGIIVLGSYNRHFYVMEDASVKASVLDWVHHVVAMVHKYNANAVVVEINQGGNMAKELMLQVDPNLNVVEVRAAKGKIARAHPIAMLYMRGLVYHLRQFHELEHQLLNLTSMQTSPDRADALVWGIHTLNQNKISFDVL